MPPKSKMSDSIFVSIALGCTFAAFFLYWIMGIAIYYFCINFKARYTGKLESLPFYTKVKFDYIIRNYCTQLKVSNEALNTGSSDEQATRKTTILNFIRDKIMAENDKQPKELLNTLLELSSIPEGEVGYISGSEMHSIPYSDNNDEYECLYPSFLYGKGETATINRYLYELFYNDLGLIWNDSGTCFHLLSDGILGEVNGVKKPLMIQSWINKLNSGMSQTIDNDNGQTLSFGNTIWAGLVYCVSSICANIPIENQGLFPVLGGPFLYFGIYFVSILFSWVTPLSASMASSFSKDGRGVLAFFSTILYIFVAYFGIIHGFIVEKRSLSTNQSTSKMAGFSNPYTFGSFINNVQVSGDKLFGIKIAAILLVCGSIIISVLAAKTTGMSPESIAGSGGFIITMAVLMLGIFSKLIGKPEECKNGWTKDILADCYKKQEPSRKGTGMIVSSDRIENINVDSTWFHMYPPIPIGSIIPYNFTQKRIIKVLSMLPSPTPKLITMVNPIYKHNISKNIPMLLNKLNTLYTGLQGIIAEHNEGSMITSDTIKYVDITVRATLVPSPATIDSDMQISETLSMLINLLNLYLVTHWYYINQSDMTTFIFNVRTNVMLLQDTLTRGSADIDKSPTLWKTVIDRVDNTLTMVLAKAPTPILLPEDHYESYRRVPPIITPHMPWLLPKLQLLMATLQKFRAITRKDPTSLTFKDVDELSAQMKVSPSRTETDDFLLDLVIVALFRFINRYLADYIIVWLTTPAKNEQPDLNSLSSFNIGIFSYIFARMLFVISVRLRRIYELITQYRGQYNLKVLDHIKFYMDHIVDNIEEVTLLPQPPNSIDPPIINIGSIPASNFITKEQIEAIVSHIPDINNKNRTKTIYMNKYTAFQKEFEAINASITAANIDLSGFKANQKGVKDLYSKTQNTLSRFITFCWEHTEINTAEHIKQVQSFEEAVNKTIGQLKDMLTYTPSLSIIPPGLAPVTNPPGAGIPSPPQSPAQPPLTSPPSSTSSLALPSTQPIISPGSP